MQEDDATIQDNPMGDLTGGLQPLAMGRIKLPPKREKVCATCRFAEKVNAARECRIKSPSVTMIALPQMGADQRGQMVQQIGVQAFTQFPVMRDDQWCGQWEPRPAQ